MMAMMSSSLFPKFSASEVKVEVSAVIGEIDA